MTPPAYVLTPGELTAGWSRRLGCFAAAAGGVTLKHLPAPAGCFPDRAADRVIKAVAKQLLI